MIADMHPVADSLPPDGWGVKLLSAVCSMKSGEGITSRALDDFSKYPCYGGNGLRGFTTRFTHEGRYALVGRQGALCGNVTAVEGKFFASEHAIVVTPSAQTDIQWLAFVLERMRLNQYSESSAQPGLSVSKLLNLEVKCPTSKCEQTAIGEALVDATRLLDALDRLIAKKRDIRRGALQQLLTSKTRLPGFANEWEQTTLGQEAVFYKGKGLPKSALNPFGAEPCIHYGELFTDYRETIKEVISSTDSTQASFRSVANDVLMPTSDVTPRGLAKASCIPVGGVILGGDILVIRADPRRIFGSFLSHVIRHDEHQVLRLVAGSTVYHLYASDMKKFRLLLPPLDEQRAIVAVLSDMDAEISALEERRAKTAAIKQGMMQALLTGRVRLPLDAEVAA